MRNFFIKNNILSKLVLTACALSLFSCNKPTAREAAVNEKIASNLVAIKDIGEVTTTHKDAKPTVYYAGEDAKDLAALSTSGKALVQKSLTGSKAQAILERIASPANKKAVATHLKDGVIGFVLLNNELIVYKISHDNVGDLDNRVESLSYLNRVKALSRASDPAEQATVQSQIAQLQNKRPYELDETMGLYKLASFKVEKFGALDNEKTDYNERKSILNVIPTPFSMATHIVLANENSAEGEAKAAEEKAAAEALAKTKK